MTALACSLGGAEISLHENRVDLIYIMGGASGDVVPRAAAHVVVVTRATCVLYTRSAPRRSVVGLSLPHARRPSAALPPSGAAS